MPRRDPRRAHAPSRPGRQYPDMTDWIEDPPTAMPTFGVPRDDERPWWRLQPGERGDDETMARKSVIHGGTCVDWPPGRHPEGWLFVTRPEVKRLLTRPDEVVACPKCRPWIGL